MKGDKVALHGSTWVVVDVAPAPELADMVAVILKDEGYVVEVKGPDFIADVFHALGAQMPGVTMVLVPENQADAALALIAESIRDYDEEELAQIRSLSPEEQQAYFEED